MKLATLALTLALALTAFGASEFDRRDRKQMLAGDRIQINKTSEWISSELSASEQGHKSTVVEQKREI